MFVTCFTNIDDLNREEWPTEFACRPMIGDTVRSAIGVQLKIVQIIHTVHRQGREAHLMIELHRGA